MAREVVEKKTLIKWALPRLSFERIPVLVYMQDCEEVEEFAAETGLLISDSLLPPTTVAGNRVANRREIWLSPDGTLHEYLEAATWETLEGGCIQRHYVGPASEENIALEDLRDAIALNLESEDDEDDA